MWPFMSPPSAELARYDPAVVDERPAPPDDRIEFTAPCDLCGEEATWKAGLVSINDVYGHGTSTVATSSTEHCAEAA